MRTFDLKYGKTTLPLSIEDQRVLNVVNGAPYPAIEKIETAFLEALDNPIGTKALKDIVQPNESVCVVVSDITRGWIGYHRFLPLLLNYLNEAGIPDEKIFLLIAYGAHRMQSEQECIVAFGEEVCKRVNIHHSCASVPESTYRRIGTTSAGVPIEINELALDADRIILTGGIVYHLMAGYGAGRKGILPGISSYEAIQKNHVFCLGPNVGDGCNPENRSGNIKTNAMHDDQLEHAKAVDADFLINVVNNAEGKLARFMTGHWYEAWYEGTRTIDKIFGVEISGLADCAIASAGGYPNDINLYQGVKTIDNAIKAVVPGGVAIILEELPDIGEPAEFINWFDTVDLYEREVKLRAGFTVPGFIALNLGEAAHRYHIIMVTREENIEKVEKTGLIGVTSLEAALEKAKALLGKEDFTVNILPTGATTMPILKETN